MLALVGKHGAEFDSTNTATAMQLDSQRVSVCFQLGAFRGVELATLAPREIPTRGSHPLSRKHFGYSADPDLGQLDSSQKRHLAVFCPLHIAQALRWVFAATSLFLRLIEAC